MALGKLDKLKLKANKYGIYYKKDITYKALEKKIKDYEKENPNMVIDDNEIEPDVITQTEEPEPQPEPTKEPTAGTIDDIAESDIDVSMLAPGVDVSNMNLDKNLDTYKIKEEKDKLKQAKRLIRVKIMNMNPDTQYKKAEECHIGNAKYGTIAARVIPFGKEWHIEYCIYEYLVNKTFSYKKEVEYKDPNGYKQTRIEYEQRPEFAISVLPPLTKEEIKKLADDQRKTDRLKD